MSLQIVRNDITKIGALSKNAGGNLLSSSTIKELLQALQAVFIPSCILQIILLKILLFHHKNFLKSCRTLWYNKPIIKEHSAPQTTTRQEICHA